MLKKANIEDIEIGNSRGKYVVPSEWQKDFYSFLEKCDLDDSVINEDKYKNNIKFDEGIIETFKETEYTADYIKEKGEFTKKDGFTMFKIGSREISMEYYKHGEKKYCIVPQVSDEYSDRMWEYYDEEEKWEFGLNEEEERKFYEGKLIVPYEIQMMKPELTIRDIRYLVYEVQEEIERQPYFENNCFILRPYYSGESEEIAKKPNFVFKPQGIEIKWYKHPLRDSYINMPIDYEEFKDILSDCIDSVLNEERKLDENMEV